MELELKFFKSLRLQSNQQSDRNYLEENKLTLAVVINVDSLLLARALIKDIIETITAIKKIIPRIQNDNASFDVDMQSMPSERSDLTLGGYSSTKLENHILSHSYVSTKIQCVILLVTSSP